MDLVMGNESAGDLDLLMLSPFVIAPGGKYVIGIAGLYLYAICVILNLTLLLVIVVERKLHRPMHFILLNQTLNDLLGSSAMVPKLLSGMLMETETVRYPLCFLQGFLLHIYGCGTLLILTAMAVDRYIAICNPLRYNRIMATGSYVLMENTFLNISFELSLDPFLIPTGGKYPIFFLGVAIYLFCVFCNLTLLVLIVTQKALHKPMYFILFSLPLNDLIGITVMLPKVLSDIITETSKVYYPLCVLQGFLLHMYGGGVLFILAAMAFDRYVAICKPLRRDSPGAEAP
ncbi:hypothetical protein AAFF_G00336090 [Aldrovandia affinis]|uniref:G-protein coupled receptors family 1 profile domain-containing protein n=1 Tax=Aldrovandia affinis TaxID=143900 RepID=A0AAD7SLD6_9TELE|nr:hypothetical protein AAFF_G00336090 [Aldrovandia affinis]